MHYRSCAWLFFLIAAAVIAVDLSERLDPQGPLGLGLEYEFSTSSSKRWQFNVHITFNKATDDITDRQLVQMALDGLAEMTKEQLQYGVKPMPRNTPAVITALRFGNEVILASSKKGNWEFMDAWPESKVSDALRRCQLAFLESNDIDSPHKNGASCGEVMAAHIFYQLYPDKDLKDMGAVAVSVMKYRLLEGGDVKAQVLDPCPLETQTHWGCNKFTADQNWRVIPVKTQGEPYDLITLSGGVQKVLCAISELTSQPALLVLSRVNKRLHHVVEPLLYSKIEWTWRPEWTPPIQKFLRSTINNPQLGCQVRSITLTESPYRLDWNLLPKIPIDDSSLHEIMRTIRNTEVAFGELWISELRSGTMDAFLAVLLSQVPRLETLLLTHTFTKEFVLTGHMLRAALFEPRNGNLPNFDHLKKVSLDAPIDPRAENRTSNTVDAMTLFYLPNIQDICTDMENPSTPAWPTKAPDPSTLTRLHLSQARESLLGHILTATPRLKSLRWDWVYEPEWETMDLQNTNFTIDLGSFSRAISHVRGTLAELWITAEVRAIYDDTMPCITGDLTSLVAFDNLVHLQAPLPVLTGTFQPDTLGRLQDFLPPNIECLTLSDDLFFCGDREWESNDILALLEPWLECRRSGKSFQRLRRLSTTMPRVSYSNMDHGEWNPLMRQTVRELCAAAGVEYKVDIR